MSNPSVQSVAFFVDKKHRHGHVQEKGGEEMGIHHRGRPFADLLSGVDSNRPWLDLQDCLHCNGRFFTSSAVSDRCYGKQSHDEIRVKRDRAKKEQFRFKFN